MRWHCCVLFMYEIAILYQCIIHKLNHTAAVYTEGTLIKRAIRSRWGVRALAERTISERMGSIKFYFLYTKPTLINTVLNVIWELFS